MPSRAARRRVRLGLALFGVLLAACAGPTTPHWSDDGVHLVDGYWILAEQPCAITADGCLAAVKAAEANLDIGPERVARAATARIPNHWTGADGRTVIVLATVEREFVVLDLQDGTRRVNVYGCGGLISVVDGTRPCGAYADDTYQAGHSPPIGP